MLGFALAALAVGVASGRFGASVAIQTGSVSTDPRAGCYTSGTSGDLVTDPVAGVAIIERTGRRVALTWPPGWTARSSGSEVEILDRSGAVHLRTGTRVYLMGGYWYVDDSFLTCGGHTLP
jgi:hypothetical protein